MGKVKRINIGSCHYHEGCPKLYLWSTTIQPPNAYLLIRNNISPHLCSSKGCREITVTIY
ncbi:hypothetical protein HMPREF1870_00407 [Bacteroidales bacterium KA00344]|nr:hypothetical protein HMPREF1870_00407 [Bacteroidales bacterium KA00344]